MLTPSKIDAVKTGQPHFFQRSQPWLGLEGNTNLRIIGILFQLLNNLIQSLNFKEYLSIVVLGLRPMNQERSTARLLDTRQHYEILDGLRGIAAVAVVVFHFMEIAVPD